MSPLVFVFDSSPESERSAADSKPPTTLRAYIISNRKYLEKFLKIRLSPLIWIKFCPSKTLDTQYFILILGMEIMKVYVFAAYFQSIAVLDINMKLMKRWLVGDYGQFNHLSAIRFNDGSVRISQRIIFTR